MNDLNDVKTNESGEGPGNKNVILYTIHCRHCKDLEKKLKASEISYKECEDIEIMRIKGFKSVPMLEVDGTIYTFEEALKWIEGVTK